VSESQNEKHGEREQEWERSEKTSEKVRERGEGEKKEREIDGDVELYNSYSISFTRGIFVTRNWPLESFVG